MHHSWKWSRIWETAGVAIGKYFSEDITCRITRFITPKVGIFLEGPFSGVACTKGVINLVFNSRGCNNHFIINVAT